MLRLSAGFNEGFEANPTKRPRHAGSQVVQIFGMIMIGIMISALAIDFGYYYAANNTIHTAADSAALAAVAELVHDTHSDPATRLRDARAQAQLYLHQNQPNLDLQAQDVVFGFIDPASKTYHGNTFATPTADPHFVQTNGFNGVWVKVRKTMDSPNGPLKPIVGNLMGIHGMELQATSVAMVDQAIHEIVQGGVRPLAACEAQLNQAMQDGILENNTVRFYSDHVTFDGADTLNGCPSQGTGNWSFVDLTGCNGGNLDASTVQDWLGAGYRGSVETQQCYSTRAGEFITNLGEAMNGLIARRVIFPIPLYRSWLGGGAKAQLMVTGFTGFQVTGYNNQRGADSYIEGHFARYICKQGCHSNPKGISTVPGSVVKLRLASRS